MKTTTAQILDIAMQVSKLDRKGKAHIRDLLAKDLGEYNPVAVRPERKKREKKGEEGATI